MIPEKLSHIKKICIATPAYGNSVTTQYLHSYGLTVEALTKYGIEVNLVTIENDALIERARNQCVYEFLKMNCDYLIFIDADIGWQPVDLLTLLAGKKDVCGIAYPAKMDDRTFVCNILQREPYIQCSETGFIKADHLGTGMLVLSRAMILKMVEVHMSEGKWYRDYQTQEPVARMFEVATGPDNTLWSEDYVFCQKWKNMGGESWIYKDAWVKHYGGKVWLDCIGNV